MTFFISCDPPTSTAQEKQVTIKSGKPIFYEPTRLKRAKEQMMGWLAPHRPSKPLTGPVYLEVHWYFMASKSHPDGSWRTTRPDTDNLEKLLKDCMTKTGYWEDDSQVAYEKVTKRWSLDPGIRIRLETIGDDR